ncbi:MAG: cysteate synthase [Spirochaetales bacterium]
MPNSHTLFCHASGKFIEDNGTLLRNPEAPSDALLTSHFEHRRFSPGPPALDFYRFDFWLPVTRRLAGSHAPITYKSKKLAQYLGLSNLYVTFSGYWPERGIEMLTGTFKECEAFSVCARLPENAGTLVVASAGNTARAFAHVCSRNHLPLLLVIPEANLEALWQPEPLHPCVRVVAVGGDSDYADAIRVAEEIASLPGFLPEGGARNVARRDGMATTVLSAVERIGRIPDYYFQAVGSGTGAIAAMEANERLIRDGRYGDHYMKLVVSQNAPFQPIFDSWRAGTRELVGYEEEDAKRRIRGLHARVLANRNAPYSVRGGLYDALRRASGDVLVCDNESARNAGALFTELEEIDPSPAASVAIASLIQAVEAGSVARDAVIMLNITGGGFAGLERRRNRVQVEPDIVLGPNETRPDIIAERFGHKDALTNA